jgi:hypothetical protein
LPLQETGTVDNGTESNLSDVNEDILDACQLSVWFLQRKLMIGYKMSEQILHALTKISALIHSSPTFP